MTIINKKEQYELVPIWHKQNLTIEEAVAYSGIGRDRIEYLLSEPDCNFVLHVGTSKRLVKRELFDEHIKSRKMI